MKHIVFIAFLLSMLSLKPLLALSLAVEVEESVIVSNWSDYIPEGVLEDFTEETGIKVDYSTYDNNEVMYEKLRLLKGRGYDVLVPSTALVDRMYHEGLLQQIDHTKLEYFKQLDPKLLNKRYDPGNKFSIPYLWGSTGIAINTEKVAADKIQRWDDLWHKQWRNKLLLLDDMREVFHMALSVNGHSINTQNPEHIKQAFEKLRRLMPNIKQLTAEKPSEYLLSGDVDIGVIWNGEIVRAKAKNPAIEYIYPAKGASFWIDSFVIPARATNVTNAHTFIDYMLRPEVAARCVQALGYATPNLVAQQMLTTKLRNNPIIFPPPEVLEKIEFKRDIGQAYALYMLYWGRLKAGS